jgi:NAD(P)-dependent dehydrogenase (short-subunit alcohol dehydrogenase family)
MSQPVAIITGAAQGIGRRTAELLSERGYQLALIDLKEPAIEGALTHTGDITNESVVAAFAEKVFAKYKRADVLVNNAGISHISPAEKIPAAEYRRVLEVNLVAPFLLCKAF